jgi:ribonucleotide reductase beta subunit family protein with ferritin-like domain
MSEKEINEINKILAILAKKPKCFRKLIEEIFTDLRNYLVKKGKTYYNLSTADEQLNYIKNCINAYSKKDDRMLKRVLHTILYPKCSS